MTQKIGRWFLPGFLLVSSITLLVIGVPRFLAELMLVPGTPIYERVSKGEQVSDEDLKVLEDSRLQALEFVELPKAYTDLGTSYLVRAQRTDSAKERLEYARRSIEVTTKGLNLAPLNTFAWLRLASANILLGDQYSKKAVEGWRTSVATARFEPFLLVQRLHIGIMLYNAMEPADIEVLKEQFQLTYRWNKHHLRAYSRQMKLNEWMVFLAGENAEQAAFF